MIGRAIVALAVVLVSAVTYPGALAVSLATRVTPYSAPGTAPRGDLPWLHVEHPSGGAPYIADDQRRMVLLHGAIPASLLEFGTFAPNSFHTSDYEAGQCPPSVTNNRYPPLCEADLAAMAALGFNSIRLPLSWSLLEPERGKFDTAYLDRIAQIVDWARAQRMYVIVDMHQNAYSFYVGPGENVNLGYNSGAPRWATFTDGFPSRVFGQNREVNPAVLEANSNFWYDRDGIQDEYIAALAFVARRFVNDPVVAGYGVYNEPWLGWNLPPGFEDLLLFPFYRRVLDALTGAHDGLPCWSGFFMPATCGYRDLGVDDNRHLFFLDTGLFREVLDYPTHLGLPVSSYPNVVLAMHAYTHVYTLDTLTPWKDYPPGGYDQSYATAVREAKAMDAALFVSEFGSDPKQDGNWLTNQLLEQEKHNLGFAFWPWKESNGSTWGMFDPPPNECLRVSRERLLGRVYPQATADTLLTFHYDPSDGLFSLHAHGRDGDPSTVVYIPPEVTGQVTLDGAVRGLVSDQADGSRLVLASPTGGAFTIAVAPAPLRLHGC
ncbi:MAG TPA: cellulase family glycosylhydrolase [Candidatus Dormibacteraeota bacterium]|nr:cellulase family glycosylhydrolase [Candidatus Dormibacteraeota bacterium]